MTSDQYLMDVILGKKAPSLSMSDWRLSNVINILNNWASSQLFELKQSGSSAKGTAIRGVADFDILISLKSDTQGTLKELYYSLDNFLKSKFINTRLQNVSIGIVQNGLSIDLVPARRQAGYQNYHSIYSSKKDSWTQTNVDLHIDTVIKSYRQDEILLTKIWRQNHGLEFPSIYLELTVLDALKYKRIGDIPGNFWAVLEYLRDSFVSSVVYDPANSNNVISDSIYKYEKEKIAEKAAEALRQQFWSNIVW